MVHNTNYRIFIETLLAVLLGIYSLLNLNLTYELNYVLIISIFLLSLGIFSLPIWERLKPLILCKECLGSGGEKCIFCRGLGYLRPWTDRISPEFTYDIKEISKKYYIIIYGIKLSNNISTGRVLIKFNVIDRMFRKNRGEKSIEIEFKKIDGWTGVEGSIQIDPIDVSDMLKLGSEPRKEDFEVKISYENLDKGEKCGNCNGKGKIYCKKCNGKRFKF